MEDTSSSTTPLGESSSETDGAPDVTCDGATSESEQDFCKGGYVGQGDVFDFADQHRGDLVVLGPLIAIAIAIASQKDAPALPIPDSLLERFRGHVSVGELNAADEGCWRFGVLLGLMSIVEEIAEAAEALELQLIPQDLPN